jgi:hypothetical protein
MRGVAALTARAIARYASGDSPGGRMPCTQSSVAPSSHASAAIAPTSSRVNVAGSSPAVARNPDEVRLRFTTRLTASPTV